MVPGFEPSNLASLVDWFTNCASTPGNRKTKPLWPFCTLPEHAGFEILNLSKDHELSVLQAALSKVIEILFSSFLSGVSGTWI